MEREDYVTRLYPLQDADLDLFVNDDDRFALWADRLIASVADRPEWDVSVGLRDPRFVRFLVSTTGLDLKVELVNDVPSRVGHVSAHPVLGRLDRELVRWIEAPPVEEFLGDLRRLGEELLLLGP